MRRAGAAAIGVACAVLLAGCAASQSDGGDPPGTVAASPGAPMPPGMTMPDGSIMTGGTPAASTAAGEQGPSAAAKMICSDEIRSKVTRILDLPSPPATTAAWSGSVYTCRYALPMGALVISVKQSPDPAATNLYYQDQRSRLAPAADAYGLGAYAFATPTGIVSLIKDSNTLTVDATALPAVFGSQQQQRNDLAYEVASVILGCWTGD